MLMPDTEHRQAEGVAERVRAAIAERPFEIGAGRGLAVTVSVGVALNEADTDTPDIIMKRADVALYRAKREGRDRVRAESGEPSPVGPAAIPGQPKR